MNPFFVILAVVALASQAFFIVLAKSKTAMWQIAGLSLLAIGLDLLLLPSVALVQQFFLTAVAALIGALLPFRRRLAITLLLAPLLFTYALFFGLALSMVHRYHAAAAQYPLESLAPRLAYEDDASHHSPTVAHYAEAVENRLHAKDKDAAVYWGRYDQLREVHEGISADFVLSLGFGVARMNPTLSHLDVPDPGPIRFDSIDDKTDEPSAQPPSLASTQPPGASLLTERGSQLHDRATADFFGYDKLGFYLNRQHVAGFIPHRFDTPPGIPPDHRGNFEVPDADFVNWRPNWAITRLELIGMLKHTPPMAYRSEYYPRMDLLEQAPVRVLDDFERAAIDKLRETEDLVIDENHRPVRMVGSLRASEKCIQCHNVAYGTLLGAFSSTLQPRLR
ncbi:MAG TPA: hypothetical protein VFE24_04745 [Pirellulales bacterium]|nr:hypothetical protein [Pirellulales bacterium]